MREKKRTVLIVDDEFRIGVLVKKLIHWSELGMECVAVKDNGEDALRTIIEKNPDIVITDVQMPKINGLDLIRITRETNKDIAFIVISGYKEFKYAKKALTYGVENYILKPISEQELNETLEKLNDKLDEKDQIVTSQEELEKTVRKSNKIIKQDFLKNIIEQENYAPDEHELITMEGDIYCGLDVKLDYVNPFEKDLHYDSIAVEKVKTLIEEILSPVLDDLLVCEKENIHIYCLCNYNFERSSVVQDTISGLLIKIKEYLMGFDQYDVTIGIGLEKRDFSEIRFSILEAYRAVCNRIRLGTGRLIYFRTIQKVENKSIPVETIKDQLSAAIDAYSEKGVNDCITKVFGEANDAINIDMTVYYEAAEKLVQLFFNCIASSQDNMERLEMNLQSKCQYCCKISQITRVLRHDFAECMSLIRTARESQSVKPVRMAKQYIEEHYKEKILLENIAEVVDLNPVYFSTLFKKETDMNFSSYLINFRMDKAKQLLTTTNDTVAAIGMEVGYNDSKYFSQLFKKVVGVKPAMYRRLHS